MPVAILDFTVALIGLAGVVIGAFISAAAQWWMQARSEAKERTFTTSFLVTALDQLAIDCFRVSQDDGTGQGFPDYEQDWRIRVPDPQLTVSADQVNLRHLDPATTYGILVIPHRIKSIAHAVAGSFEFDDPPDFQTSFEERQYLFAQLGLDVAMLSDKIRRENSIPPRPSEIWNPVPELQQKMSIILESRAKRAFRL